MTRLYLYTLLFLFGLCVTQYVQGQETDHKIVLEVYDALQDKNRSSKDLAVLAPGLNWDEARNKTKAKRYKIALISIVNNEWGSIRFDQLKIESTQGDKLVVKGIVNGRKHLECEFVSHPFTHYWTLKNGELIHLSEQY